MESYYQSKERIVNNFFNFIFLFFKILIFYYQNRVKNNQELRDDIYSQVNKKKNLQVKIKLPNETMSDDYEPTEPIKKRKAQRCCLCMFTFMMLLIGFGIFIYFFGFIAKYYKLF
jgi:hypothetical protein